MSFAARRRNGPNVSTLEKLSRRCRRIARESYPDE